MTPTNSEQGSTTDTAVAKASDVAASTQTSAKEIASEAASHAQNLLEETRSKGREQVQEQGERAAKAAKTVSSELRTMAGASSGQFAGLVEQGADQIDSLVARFNRDGIEGISQEVRRLARRRPLAFIGGTFAAGFATGRTLRNADTDDLKDAVTEELSTDTTNPSVPPSTSATPLPPVTTSPGMR